LAALIRPGVGDGWRVRRGDHYLCRRTIHLPIVDEQLQDIAPRFVDGKESRKNKCYS
jgi:hypothetical protein